MTVADRQLPLPASGERPSLHGTPAAMASLLGHGIPAGLVERMLTVPHIRARLDAELRERLGELPAELTPAQAGVASLDQTGLLHLTLRSGAVWHAATIARAHDGATVRALVERIGPEFREAALADLAGHPRAAAAGAVDPGLDDMPTAIARDGTACMVSWCEAQPRAVGWRILLRLRTGGRPSPRHAEFGPAIVERLAASDAGPSGMAFSGRVPGA